MRAAETGSTARAMRDVRNGEELVSLLSTIAGTKPTLCGKTPNSYSAAGSMQASRMQTRGVTGLKSYVRMSQDRHRVNNLLDRGKHKTDSEKINIAQNAHTCPKHRIGTQFL